MMKVPFISGHTKAPEPFEHIYIDFLPGTCGGEEASGFWSVKGSRWWFSPYLCIGRPGTVWRFSGSPLDVDTANVKYKIWPVHQLERDKNLALIGSSCENVFASKSKPTYYSTDLLTLSTCGIWAQNMWSSAT